MYWLDNAAGCLTHLVEVLHGLLLVWQCCSMPISVSHSTAGEAIHGHPAQQESGISVLWAWREQCRRAECYQLPQESVQHARPAVQRPQWWACCLTAHCWGARLLLLQVYSFRPPSGSLAGVHTACGPPITSSTCLLAYDMGGCLAVECLGNMPSLYSTC